MATNEELISEYIDLTAVGTQTDAFMAQLDRINKAYDQLAQKGVNLGGLSSSKEITAQIKELQAELARLQKAKEDVLTIDLKQARVDTENAKAARVRTQSIIDQNKELDRQIALEEKSNAAKAKSSINTDVPFTSNLAELEAERNAANATGDAVSQLERDQVEASIAATEWANAQRATVSASGQAAKATKLSSDELERNEKILVEEKLLQTQRAAALKNQVASENAVKGSLEQRRLALIRLNAEYDRIGPQDRSSAAGQRLQKIIAGLSTQVKTLEADTGRAQRNVGNYGAAFEKTASNFDKFGQALGKGFGVLRQAANILPGIGIAGLIGGATDAIISFVTAESEATKATEELAKAQKELDSTLNQAVGSATSQGEQVRILARAVQDANLPYIQRQRALEDLQKINKKYFGDLTLEGDIYGGLQKKVQDYTTALILANVQKARGENLTKANIELADTRRELQSLDEQISKRQLLIKINFDNLKASGLNNLAGVQSANQMIASDSKILALGEKRLALYDRLGKATDEAGNRAIEFEDATRAALTLPGLEDPTGGTKKDTRLKQFQDKENDDRLKAFIQTEKEASAALDGELSQRLAIRQDAFERELILTQNNFEKERDIARAAANDVLNDPNATENAKINARRKLYADLKTIDNNAHASALTLQEQYEKDYDRIIATAREKRKADDKRDNELAEAQFKAEHDARLKKREQEIKDRDNTALRNRDDSTLALQQVYASGLISKETYEKRKFDIEKKYSIESQQNLIADAQFLIDNRKEFGANELEQEKNIAELKKKISDDLTQRKLDNEEKVRQAEKETARQVISAVGELVGDGYDKQKNAIQDQINQLEIRKNKEIDLATASITKEQERAAAIANINTAADQQREVLERKQKDADIKKAEFEKVIAIAQIAIQTGQSVQSISIKAAEARAEAALWTAKGPAGAAFASLAYASAAAIAAQIPLVIAQGVIAAGLVAARPIPRYRSGTTGHPGGEALLGDGGKHEYVLLQNGEGFVTPNTNTIMNLPKGAQVFPDINNLPEKIMMMAMKPLRGMPIGTDNGSDKISKEIRALRGAIMSKRENYLNITGRGISKAAKDGDAFTHYVNSIV